MKADSLTIFKVFQNGGDIHYVLPHFQREYSWGEKQLETLLKDAFAIYEEYDSETSPPEHFLGSLVVINDGTRNGTITAFKLVDGQQRLTTISLLICALRNLARNNQNYLSLSKKCQKMLVNSDEDLEMKFII